MIGLRIASLRDCFIILSEDEGSEEISSTSFDISLQTLFISGSSSE